MPGVRGLLPCPEAVEGRIFGMGACRSSIREEQSLGVSTLDGALPPGHGGEVLGLPWRREELSFLEGLP